MIVVVVLLLYTIVIVMQRSCGLDTLWCAITDVCWCRFGNVASLGRGRWKFDFRAEVLIVCAIGGPMLVCQDD